MKCWACNIGVYSVTAYVKDGAYEREVMKCDHCGESRLHSNAKLSDVVPKSTVSKVMSLINEGYGMYVNDIVVDGDETFSAGWTSAMLWMKRKLVEDDIQ